MTELWAHQQEYLDKWAGAPAVALLWEPRCGKTRAVVYEMMRLDPERILIVCPKTVASVWAGELAQIGLTNPLDLSSYSVQDSADALKILGRYRQVSILNYDKAYALMSELNKWRPEYVVADEMHKIKQAGSKRSRALHGLGKRAKYRRGLSGTPDPKDLADYYSEFKYLDPGIFGTNYQQFADQYLHLHPLYRSKVVGYRNVPELREKVFSIAHRVRRQDCFDIPRLQEVTRRITMTDEQAQEYRRIASAPYPAKVTKLLRLQQFTASIKAPYVEEELDEIVEAGQSAVVFTRFRQEGDATYQHLCRAYGGGGDVVYRLVGDSSTEERKRISVFSDYTSTPRIAVVQIATGSLGISLRGADYAVFSSLSFDASDYVQAKDRIWDPTNPKTLIYLVVDTPDHVDDIVLEAVRNKQNVSEEFLEGKL